MCYVGSLTIEKNLPFLLDCLASTDHHLIVVGDGGDRAALEETAGRLLGDRAHFVGQVSDPASFLAASDVLAIPSLTEGMPGVAIEAGFARIPVAATDVGWVKEIVVDGATGRLAAVGDHVGFGNAIGDCIDHKAAYGDAGRRRCLERFEMGVVAALWADALEEVAGRGGERRFHRLNSRVRRLEA